MNYVMVAGGYDPWGRISDVEIVDPFSAGVLQCQPIGSLPKAIQGLVSVSMGHDIRVCGGQEQSEALSGCYELTNGTNQWVTSNEPLRHARSDAATLLLPDTNKTWIVGGHPDSSTSEMFDHINKTFEEGVSLPEGMGLHCMVAINTTHSYIAGNEGQGHDRHMAYIVSHVGQSFAFSKLPPMLVSRVDSACGVIHETPQYPQERDILLVAGGGYVGFDNGPTRTEMYLPGQNIWVEGPNLPLSLTHGGVVNIENGTILIGGIVNSTMDGTMMLFNHTSLEVTVLTGKLTTPRAMFATIPITDDNGIC